MNEALEPGSEGRGAVAPPPACVYLVDDEDAVRDSLAMLLRLRGYTIREFASAESFLDAFPLSGPACALVDIRLPGISGLALHERLRRENRAPPMLFMTAHAEAGLARALLQQGERDLFEKPIEASELLPAIEDALRRDRDRIAAQAENERLCACWSALSGAERAIFEGLTDGIPVRQIAAQLGIDLDQVEAGRAELMRKFDMRRLTDFVRLRLRLESCGSLARR